MSQTFSLHIVLTGENEKVRAQLKETIRKKDTCWVAHASSCRISQQEHHGEAQYALLFVPATIVDSSLEQWKDRKDHSFQCLEESEKTTISDRLLSMIHPFLARNFPLQAVIPVRNNNNHSPSDLVLLDLSHTPAGTVSDLLEQCHMLHSGPQVILKMLLIDHVHVARELPSLSFPPTSTLPTQFNIPTCPVCLHRIDPPRLGWTLPRQEQLCSRFCPPPDLYNGGSSCCCPKQRLLEPWPRPSCCSACRVIHTYWNAKGDVCCCMACGMQETLWVCLTCAFIGCGRYSNKHAAQHFRESGHPFCLELTTLRIWDYYGEGGFAHRVDLLECPSSPPLTSPWIHAVSANHGITRDEDNGFNGLNSFPFESAKSPKKATMISEEYEALLQSALEEQAQHYEGEISRLRAELTASVVSRDMLSETEQSEIDHIIASNDALRANIESTKRSILDLQSQEAPLRAASNRLLREQQTAKDLLIKVQEDNRRERHAGNVQVDELEQQIADLTTNQRMREQFMDEELQNAQIFGTSEQKKRAGKKTKRFFRK